MALIVFTTAVTLWFVTMLCVIPATRGIRTLRIWGLCFAMSMVVFYYLPQPIPGHRCDSILMLGTEPCAGKHSEDKGVIRIWNPHLQPQPLPGQEVQLDMFE